MYPFIISKIYSIFEYNGPEFWRYAINILALALGLQLGRRILASARAMFDHKMRPLVWISNTESVYNRIYDSDYKFFVDKNVGFIQSQARNICSGFRALAVDLPSGISGIIIGLGIIFGLLMKIDSVVAGLILANGIIMMAWKILIMRKSARLSAESAKADSKFGGVNSDSISNFMNIKVFAKTQYELEYTRKSRMEWADKNWKFWRFDIITDAISWFMDTCIMWMATIAYSIYLFKGGIMNVAGFALVISAQDRFKQEFMRIGNIIQDTNHRYAEAKQAWTELMVPRKIKDRRGAKPLRIARGAVDLRGISFRYHSDWVVRDFSLKIRAGEKVGVVGTSGAGKTTLSHLLLRLFDVHHGGIFIDGQNIKDVLQDSLRSQIAFVPQDPVLFNRTLAENISYARPDASAAEIEHAAKLADIHSFIIGTEKGYDTLVGNRGIKLSGGQRQRVAIARAILKNSPILILDEATSALDSETEQSIQKSFDALMKKRTTIAIAHRLSTLRKMDRIVVMDAGRIAEQGTHDELLRHGGIYAKLWTMQSGGFV
jgi:ABC-type multidrug transport system fused ATPase/permease subunit